MSKLEETMAFQMRAVQLPPYARELQFAPPRRWRFDFAWPDQMVALEVEGITSFGRNKDGTMRLGRHQSANGFEKDCEKYNEALLGGWRVVRVTGAMVGDGRALQYIERALSAGKKSPG
jgi:hypothetical protein